jgi:fibronectin-binding autotransporter adhesin
MGVVISNTTDNKIYIDGTGGITISSIISGANNLSLNGAGAGALTLSGVNTFGGAAKNFTLNAGTLNINNASALGNSSNTFIINGGTVNNTSGSAITTSNYAQTWGGNFTFTGTNALNLGTGAVSLSASREVTVSASTLTIGGIIGEAAAGYALAKLGAGTLALTNANSYTGGTTVTLGTLTLGHATNTLSNAGTVLVNGGILDLGTNTDTVGAVTLSSGSITGSGTSVQGVLTGTSYALTGTGSVTAKLAGTSVTLTKSNAGTATLSAANSYTGATTITGGTLALGSAGSINDSPTITVGTGAIFDVSAVSGGYSLASGQTLQGTGTVNGPMTVASGSTLSPGNSPGNLSVGNTTFAAGGNYNWQMLSATGTAGTDWDLLTVGGTLDITATSDSKFNLNLWSLSGTGPDVNGNANNFNNASNYAWKIVGATSITGFAADKFAINTTATNDTNGFLNNLNGGTFSVSQSDGDLNLVFTAADVGANLYWDGSGNWGSIAPGAGGTGTWANDSGGWNPDKIANFSGTAAAVTVTTATANKGINFLADGYSLTGGTLTLSTTPADNVITVGSTMTTTLSSAIATSAGIIKSGAGNLIFDTTQSYTGGTTVSSGTLTLGHATNTLSDTEALSVSGSLALGANNDTVGSLALNGASITGSGTLTATTYALGGGTVSANLGAGTATSNSGTTTFNGTLAADLTVSGGTVNLGASDRLSDTSALTISSGTFGISTFDDTVGSFTLSSTGILGGSTGVLTAPAYALQGGTVNARLGAGPVTVTTATTTLGSAGRLTNSSSLDITSGQLSLGGNESVASFSLTAGTLGGSGTLSSAAGYTLSGGTVSANLGSGLASSSTGTTALNGTLAGDLTVSGGTVNLGAADRLSNTSAIAVSSGTLGISTFNDTVGSFTLSGGSLGGSTGILTAATYALQGGTVDARLGAGAITVSTATTTLGSAGRFSSTPSLAITSGQLTLAGDETVSTYSQSPGTTLGGSGILTATTYALNGGTINARLGAGTATVSSGTTTLSSAGRLSPTTNVSVPTGTLNLGGDETISTYAHSGGTLGGTGKLTATSFALTGGTINVGFAGTGSVTVTSGTTSLGGDSTGFTGATTVSGGTLSLETSTALGSSAVTMSSGEVFGGAGTTRANAIVIGTAAGVGPASLLAGWDFQTTTNGGTASASSPNTPTSFTANFGTGNLYLNGTNGSSTWLSSELDAFAGTTVNGGTGFATTTGAPATLSVLGGNANSANGKSMVFKVNMANLSNLVVSYATRWSGTSGFTSQDWSYSTDGSNWLSLQTITQLTTTFTTQTLSSISALNGATNAYVRLTLSGASASSGNNRLDNIQFNANTTTVASGSGTLGISVPGTTTFSGPITVNNTATLSAVAGGTANFSGVLGGPGSISKTGAGSVVLSAANTYTGSTTITTGTLQLGSGGTTGSLSISSAITNNGTFTINRSNAVSQGTDFSSSAITGTGGLSQAGSGTTTLNAANTYSGGTTLSAGRLNLNNASAIGTGAFTITGGSIDATVPGITLSTNNVLNLNADFTFAGTNNLNLGTGDINLNANRIITVTANTLTLGGNITSELYTITKQGDGTLNLTGTNAYTGPTTISSGVVSISNVAALGTGTAAVSIAGGSSLEYSGATDTLTKDITVTSGIGTIRNTGVNTLTLSGVLTKDGTVLKFTGGTFNVSGRITGSSANSDLVVDNATVTLTNDTNDYNGPTFIQNSGKVIMAGDYLGAVPGSPTAGNVVLDNGTLNTTADVSLSANRGIAVGPSTGSGTGTLEAAGSTTLTVNGIIANNGSGTGALTKTGGGTVALIAANTYTGATTISGGTLSVGTIGNGGVAGNLGQAGNAATNLVFDGGTLEYTGSTATSDRAFTINAGKTATINTANGLTLAGATGAATDGALTKTGAGNLTLTGAGTNTGSTTISAGTLQLGAGGTTGSLSTSSAIINNGTFAINRSNAVSQGTDFSGSAISGSGGLSQAGAGMTTLNAANTYTGGTTASAGTLNITNTSGSATGTGNVLIQDTATLQGSGSIVTAGTREITVNSGGTVAIGAIESSGTLGEILTLSPESGTITTTFETGSTLRFDLFTNAGNNYATTTAADLFRTGGNLTFQTGVNLKVNQSGTFTFANGNQWRLLDWTTLLGNAPTGNTSQLILDLPTLDPDLFWDVSTLYTNGSIGVVPEPSRTLFLALGLLTLTLRRRR